MEHLGLPKDFMILAQNDHVVGCYEKVSKLLAYDVRQKFIRAVAADHEVHVFSKNVLDDVAGLKITYHPKCDSISDLMHVYKRSGVTLNFCHTQMIDTVNQRYFNAPYQNCPPLSLINSVQHDLLPGTNLERFTFRSTSELKDKLLDVSGSGHTAVLQSWSDTVHRHHRYKNRWEVIFGQFGLNV